MLGGLLQPDASQVEAVRLLTELYHGLSVLRVGVRRRKASFLSVALSALGVSLRVCTRAAAPPPLSHLSVSDFPRANVPWVQGAFICITLFYV